MITRLALTPGEPAGIGPDLCIKLAQHPPDAQLVVVGDQQLMAQRAAALDLPLTLVPLTNTLYLAATKLENSSFVTSL